MTGIDIICDGVTGSTLKAARRYAYRLGRQLTLTTDQTTIDALLAAWSCFMRQFSALDQPDFVLIHLTHAYEAGLYGDDTSDIAFSCRVAAPSYA